MLPATFDLPGALVDSNKSSRSCLVNEMNRVKLRPPSSVVPTIALNDGRSACRLVRYIVVHDTKRKSSSNKALATSMVLKVLLFLGKVQEGVVRFGRSEKKSCSEGLGCQQCEYEGELEAFKRLRSASLHLPRIYLLGSATGKADLIGADRLFKGLGWMAMCCG